MITPDAIKKKAEALYPKFLSQWVRRADADFFPHRVPANLAIDKQQLPASIHAVQALKNESKAVKGWGYTYHERFVESPDGHGPRPDKITIDALDDLLRLAGKVNEFRRTQQVANRLREELPQLEGWITQHVHTIAKYRQALAGLIAVAQYFVANPMPDCYPQQLPVAVDTKFIVRHQAVLRQWLDLLLPPAAMVAHETNFMRRFGLREPQHQRGLLLLDEELRDEMKLPFDELAAPVRSLASLSVRDVIVVVVENKTPLLSVPRIRRGLVIAGDGASAPMLAQVPWLHTNRVLYWGDIDAAGFEILSRLRSRIPHVESVMMDEATYEAHKKNAKAGCRAKPQSLPYLTPHERRMYVRCVAENLMLEQEKLLQKCVHSAFATASINGG